MTDAPRQVSITAFGKEYIRKDIPDARIAELESALTSIINLETKGGRSWAKPTRVSEIASKALRGKGE